MIALAVLLLLFGLKAVLVRHGMRRPAPMCCPCILPVHRTRTLRMHCAHDLQPGTPLAPLWQGRKAAPQAAPGQQAAAKSVPESWAGTVELSRPHGRIEALSCLRTAPP